MSEDRTITVGEAAADAAPTADTDELPIVEQSRYRLESEHARGGLGRIFTARDQRLDRTVAVKELLHLDSAARARFVREAKVTARLQHPSIVPIYEAGRWPSGEPFYAMKLVAGQPLSELLDRAGSVAERLAYLRNVRAVAEAVAYAHSERIVHRDLKPSNIVIGAFGETMVIDWGLAKDLSADEPDIDVPGGAYRTAERGMTVAGSVLGTPAYMPPEQARGESVDERADIYALGAMLYHTLAGQPPYRGDSSDAVLARVLADAPPPLPADAPPDLAAIANRAMARAPADRYPTAAAVAADLERFETGQLVTAHRYSPGALVRRWLRRHRAIVTVAALALLALAVGGALSIRRIIAEERTAQRERAVATQRANALLLQRANDLLDVDPTAALELVADYPPAGREAESARQIAGEAVMRGVADTIWSGFDAGLTVVAVSADGARVAVGTSAGTVHLLDVATGDARDVLAMDDAISSVHVTADAVVAVGARGEVAMARGASVSRRHLGTSEPTAAAVAPDLERVGVGGADGVLYVWRPRTNAVETLAGHEGPIVDVAFSPDGQRIATAGLDGAVNVWSAGADRALAHASAAPVYAIAWSNDAVLFGGVSGALTQWTPATDETRVLATADDPIASIAAAASGEIAYGTTGGALALLDPTGTQVDRAAMNQPIHRVQLAGRTLVATPFGQQLRVTSLATGDAWHLAGHTDRIEWSALSGDGTLLASIGSERTVRLWRLQPRHSRILHRSTGPARMIEVDGDGEVWAASFRAGELVLGRGERVVTVVTGTAGDADVVRVNPAGTRVAVTHAAGVSWRDASSGDLVAQLDVPGVDAVEILPSGDSLVVGNRAGTLLVWTPERDTRETLAESGDPILDLSVSSDGRSVVVATAAGEIVHWDIASRAPRWRTRHLGVAIVAFVAGGPTVASAGTDGALRLWRPDGTASQTWRPGGAVSRPNLALDGTVAAVRTGSGIAAVALPDLTPLRLAQSYDVVTGVGFAGGTTFVTRANGAVRVWPDRAGPGRLLVGHTQSVVDATALANGAMITLSADGTARVWPAAEPTTRPRPVRRVRPGSSLPEE